jgi:hypothetical protein
MRPAQYELFLSPKNLVFLLDLPLSGERRMAEGAFLVGSYGLTGDGERGKATWHWATIWPVTAERSDVKERIMYLSDRCPVTITAQFSRS